MPVMESFPVKKTLQVPYPDNPVFSLRDAKYIKTHFALHTALYAVPVNKTIFGYRQMIMYYVLDICYIQATRCQIG